MKSFFHPPSRLFLQLLCCALQQLASARIVDVTDYWPELNGDLTKVTWSHATNSQELLAKALSASSGIMMMEADVSLGWLEGQDPIVDPKIPIMAHPPETRSDLSLEQFLNKTIQVTNGGLKKGIKLDLKSTEVAEEGLKMAEKYQDEFHFPVWSNADIEVGPHLAPDKKATVDADKFLALCQQHLPAATLSLGFTTPPFPAILPETQFQYTWDMVKTMKAALEKNAVLGKGKSITFALRGIFLGKSLEQIQWLLDQTSDVSGIKSTVTIWGKDPLSQDQLTSLRAFLDTVGRDRCYTDTSADLNPTTL